MQKIRFHLLVAPDVFEQDMERIRGFVRRAGEQVQLLDLFHLESDCPKRCIYIVNSLSGVTKDDIDSVLKAKGVCAWLIVICGLHGRNRKKGFEVLSGIWRQSLKDISASVSIIADDENCQDTLLKWIRTELALGEHGNICLITSTRGCTGRSSLRECLESVPQSVDWQFEERLTTDEDYPMLRDAASRVVFVGSELEDFAISPFAGGIGKSFFFLGKCDVQPIYMAAAKQTSQSILDILNQAGWDMASCQKCRIFSGTALYSRFYADLNSQRISFSNLAQMEEFAMWDEFLLPQAREAYTEKNMLAFLQSCDVISRLAEGLFVSIKS